MTVHEVVFNAKWLPNKTSSTEVLGYLLMDARVIAPYADEDMMPMVRGMLHAAQRDLLLDWYRERRKHG